MQKNSYLVVAASSFFAVVSVGCAHPQTVTTLTSAATVAPAAQVAPAAPPIAEATPPTDEPKADDAKPAAKKSGEPMTFAELSSALGGEEKMGLEMDRSTPTPTGKGLSADGYAAAGVAHQAADTSGSSHLAGDIKVSGGLTAAAIRSGVHGEAARLRACYEHGLSVNPHLAGTVTVSFSVDDHGAVSDVETASDAIPADVTSCIQAAFNAMTFAPAKNPPAKVVYPIDFNKDS
jgi:hypothetical protein